MGKLAKSSPRAGLLIGYEVWRLPIIQATLFKQLIIRVFLACFIFIGSILAIQLVYPHNRTLPFSKFSDVSLGFLTTTSAQFKLDQLNSRQISINTGNKIINLSLNEIGLSIQSQELVEQFSNYPLKNRLVPFSILAKPDYGNSSQTKVFDQNAFNAFTVAISRSLNTKANEGKVLFKNGSFTVESPRAGRNYTADAISQYFSIATDTAINGHAVLAYQSNAPQVQYEELQQLSNAFQNFVSKDFLVRYGQRSVVIPREVLMQSINIVNDPNLPKQKLKLTSGELISQLEYLADEIFLAPKEAQLGQELDFQKTIANIEDAAANGLNSTSASAKSIPMQSGSVFPATSTGIQQIIEKWRSNYPWIDIAVDFQQINGQRSAGIDDKKLFFSASVYKVLAAWRVLYEVDAARLDPEKPLVGGKNLDECLEEMIVISASNCAEGVVKKYGGYTALDDFVRSHHIEGINLSRGLSISADGMRQFLHNLYSEKLMSKASTDKLLSYMKRQNYRKGIPAGSAGEVADKVGYNPRNPSWHDAAIVYHPKTTYTLVVLTASGGQFPIIADLAKQISDTLNR